MISTVARGGSLAPLIKSASQPHATPTIAAARAVAPKSEKKIIPTIAPRKLRSFGLASTLPTTKLQAVCGPQVITSVRYAHTDIQVPDFTPYRRDSVKSPTARNRDSEESRKSFSYVMVAACGMATAYAAKSTVTKFVMSMSATADVLALSKVEINLNDVPEGKNVIFKWRGKPLFVRHRTAEEIEVEQNVQVSTLRDPQHDNDRVQHKQWLIVLGVCTHLGCVPISNAGDYGGYYCPCHGSHYDASGRIRKGPAPLNLEVPPHVFGEGNLLVVG